MANHTGSDTPETDMTPISILLPRTRRYDQHPITYVVTVFDDLPSTSPKVKVASIDPGHGAETTLLPPNVPSTDPCIHPAYYTPETGTIPDTAESPKEAEPEQKAPEQEPHCPTKETTDPPREKSPTDFTTLAHLLDEIYQARPCPRCHTPPGAKNRHQNSICYFHRRFGESAMKCRTPCSFSGRHHSSVQ